MRGVGSSNLPVPTIYQLRFFRDRDPSPASRDRDFTCDSRFPPQHAKNRACWGPRLCGIAHARKTAQVQICPSRPIHSICRWCRYGLVPGVNMVPRKCTRLFFCRCCSSVGVSMCKVRGSAGDEVNADVLHACQGRLEPRILAPSSDRIVDGRRTPARSLPSEY